MHKIIAGACVTLLSFVTAILPPDAAAAPAGWPAWQSFRQHFIQQDGRVVEHDAQSRTTSEGQAYAMFFALVNDQRELFDRVLQWTENNLSQGDLRANLSGWWWGHASGKPPSPAQDSASRSPWRLLDDNSASDADLWMAYALLEAGRLWQVPRYSALGRSLLEQVRQKEVLHLPDGFFTLLPAARGFRLADRHWRVNPSYFMPQQLALFARVDPAGPWQALASQLPAMLSACCPSGYAPDWVSYHAGSGWKPDRGGTLTGSYDAIRVYLWAGMLDRQHPGRERLLVALQGMRGLLKVRGEPPERIDVLSGRATGRTPPGFFAAVLPYLQAHGERELASQALERLRVAESDGLYGSGRRYYDQVLALFGLGFVEGRFRFNHCGELVPAWRAELAAGC